MRLVVISDTALEDGGAESLGVLMAARMAAAGLPVTFITGDRSHNDVLTAADVSVRNIGAFRITPSAGSQAIAAGIYNPQVDAYLARHIAQQDGPDTVYHLHAWSKALTPAVFKALSPVAHRVFIHTHDFFLTCPNANYFHFRRGGDCGQKPMSLGCIAANCSKRNYLDKAWRVSRTFALNRVMDHKAAWRLLMPHERMRERFRREGFAENAMTVVPNPSEPLSPRPVDVAANKGLLFIGRLSPEKGPDLACAAARAAGLPLTVIGDGEMRIELETAYPEVNFVGWQDKASMAPLAQRSRALLLSSRSPEPFGIAATEALGAGLPVFAAESAFLSSDLVRLGCGESVDVLNTAAFAERLRAFSVDDARATAMSARARQAFRELSPTPKAWAELILEQYALVSART
jgi:glycosyltransferase involved in cell wall biosynthesis